MASIHKRVWTTAGADGKPHTQTRWDSVVFLGRDEAGHMRLRSKTFRRETDAKAWATQQEVARAQNGGAPTRESRDTLASYLRHWLEVKAGQLRRRTLADYREALFRWVLPRVPGDPERRPVPPVDAPRIGDVRLDRLNTRTLEMLYNWMHAHGSTPGTIRRVHKTLSQALKAAARKGLVARNWAEVADVPARDGGDPAQGPVERAMNREQATAFLTAARGDRHSGLWHLLLLGGLRPGEAFGLKWSDVDFEQGRIHVQRSLVRVSGVTGWALEPPKTKTSRRSVPLPPVAMAELKRWKKVQATEHLALGPAWHDHGLVFTTHDGNPLNGTLVHSAWVRVMAAAAAAAPTLGTWGKQPKKPRSGPTARRPFTPAFRVYDLRHTCATLLLLAGENVKTVSERLGHASVTLTLDVYSHVLPDMQQQAAAKLERMFGTGPT